MFTLITIIIGAIIGGWFSDKISRINSIIREYNHTFQLMLNTNNRSLTSKDYDYYRDDKFKNKFMESCGVTKEEIKNSLKIITFEFNTIKTTDNFIYKNIQYLFEYNEAFESYNSGVPFNYNNYGDELTYLTINPYISKSYLCRKIVEMKSEKGIKILDNNFYNTDFNALIECFNSNDEINKEIVNKLKMVQGVVNKVRDIKQKRISTIDIISMYFNKKIFLLILCNLINLNLL